MNLMISAELVKLVLLGSDPSLVNQLQFDARDKGCISGIERRVHNHCPWKVTLQPEEADVFNCSIRRSIFLKPGATLRCGSAGDY